MTVVKKLKKSKHSAVKKKSPVIRSRKKISTDIYTPSGSLSDYAILIYGREGIGKTTLLSQFMKVYFLMFENNKSFKVRMDLVSNWDDFLDFQYDLINSEYDFKGISIDGVKAAYEQSMLYSCKKYGIDHPGAMNDRGDSWNKVKKEFINPMRELSNSKYGFLASCHATEKEIIRVDGFKYNMIAPDLSKQAYEFFVGEIDNVFYYFYEDNQRWLQITGDEHIVAKNRMDENFITTNGEKIFKIPMGNNKKESFKNLMKAFNNEQEKPYLPEIKSHVVKKKKKNKERR